MQQIGDRAHVAEIAKVFDVALAEAFDVYRSTRGEMEDRLSELRGAGKTARAARNCRAFLAHDLRAANRTERWHAPGFCARRTPFDYDADDFGNDVAGTPHDDRVADAHVQARDLIGVVQRRIGDGDAADEHRLELRCRRRCPGAADVDDDVLDRRRLLLCRKFVRDRPARRAADEAEFALQREVVDLVDDAIDVERQRIALIADALVVVETALGTDRRIDERAHRQTPVAQHAQRLRMRRRQRATLDDADRIGEERERPPRGDTRIELAQRSRRCVARIDQQLDLAVGEARGLVVFLEAGSRHVDLAAHLDHVRRVSAQAQRNGLDRAQVRSHVLARFAVAACGATHEQTVFVAQADREPVELRLDRKRQRCIVVEPVADATHELADFLGIERIRKRKHRNRVTHLGEFARWRRADALGRRFGRHQFRMRGFERFEFAHQQVVLGVRERRFG